MKGKLHTYLLSLPVPAKLQDAEFETVAAAICDEKTFELFQQNCKGRTFRKWTLVARVAVETQERAATFPDKSQTSGADAGYEPPKWARALYERHKAEQAI